MKKMTALTKKILTILLISGGGLTLVGGGVFSIGMATAGWDFSAMNTVDYVYQEYVETQTVNNVVLNYNTSDVKVFFDETATQVRVEYAEKFTKNGNRINNILVTEENGTLKILEKTVRKMVMQWSVGENAETRVYLPKDREYALNIETDTGDIFFNGYATLSRLDVETDTGNIDLRSATVVCDGAMELSVDTGNVLLGGFVTQSLEIDADTGDIALNGNGSVSGKASIETDTGDVKIPKTFTAASLEIETETGDVTLGNISGTSLKIRTDTGDIECISSTVLDFINLQFNASTGDIKLHLVGEWNDYFITTSTSTGRNNLYSSPENSQPRKLTVRTSTGDINGYFLPKMTDK